jgi:flavin reductase (DIM6/NTAB) family NADH-FMN oxidoreductase RutF
LPISGDEYKQIGRAAAGAVSVVSAYEAHGKDIVALTVSSFVTLSFDPPLVMFALQHNADSYPAMIRSTAFGVSLLCVGQVAVANRFASKGKDKTRGFEFDTGVALQVPLIPGSLAQIECETREIIVSGDHAIIVGLVQSASTRDAQPLLYFARQYGHFTAIAGA